MESLPTKMNFKMLLWKNILHGLEWIINKNILNILVFEIVL